MAWRTNGRAIPIYALAWDHITLDEGRNYIASIEMRMKVREKWDTAPNIKSGGSSPAKSHFRRFACLLRVVFILALRAVS